MLALSVRSLSAHLLDLTQNWSPVQKYSCLPHSQGPAPSRLCSKQILPFKCRQGVSSRLPMDCNDQFLSVSENGNTKKTNFKSETNK